jgi:hypothetical protein
MIHILNARRPARPEEEDVCRALVTDALWAMVESCWAQDASIRPTAAAVVSQLAARARSYNARKKCEYPVILSTCIPHLQADGFWREVRAAVLTIMAIERMSRLLENQAWISQSKAFNYEHSPDASHAVEPSMLDVEGLSGRDISLPAHDCVLSKQLIQHLETLICDGVAVQTALDILDRVRAQIKKHIIPVH